MRKTLLILGVLVFISCGKKEQQEETKATPESTVIDTTVESKIVGADEDIHGCKSSAGYTWSELKKECVRLFEIGTRLNPMNEKDNESTATSAFVIFEENGNKAELFVVSEPNPIILERKSEGDSYVNGDWQLIPWKGYVLKKGGDILYTGQ